MRASATEPGSRGPLKKAAPGVPLMVRIAPLTESNRNPDGGAATRPPVESAGNPATAKARVRSASLMTCLLAARRAEYGGSNRGRPHSCCSKADGCLWLLRTTTAGDCANADSRGYRTHQHEDFR